MECAVQMPLENQQAQGIVRKPFPISDSPHSEEMFPDTHSEPPLAQLCAIPIPPRLPRSRSQQLPLLPFLRGCRVLWGRLSVSCSSDQATLVPSGSPHSTHLPALLPALCPPQDASKDLNIPFMLRTPSALWWHSAGGEAKKEAHAPGGSSARSWSRQCLGKRGSGVYAGASSHFHMRDGKRNNHCSRANAAGTPSVQQSACKIWEITVLYCLVWLNHCMCQLFSFISYKWC